jgi:hypothetical protein
VRAEWLFSEARREMMRGEIAHACELFAESHALDPASGTLANLAMCEEQLGQLDLARTHWEEVFDESTASGRADRAALAREHIRDIDKKLTGP